MIYFILENYFITLMVIANGTALLFFIGLYALITRLTFNNISNNKELSTNAEDIQAISGHDIFATQLDLARAYIEIKNHKEAKKILTAVRLHGNVAQQMEANHLLDRI